MSYSTYAKYRDSGFKWIGNIPEPWDVRRLKNLLDSPVTDGPHLTPEFLYEGIPFLSVDGIQDGELQFEGCRYVSIADHQQFAKKAAPRRGDVLLGKAASTGKIAQVKVDFEFNIWSPLALLRPNQAEITSTYLEYALKSPAVQAQIDVLCTHNTQSNISMDDIPKLVLPLPSSVEQQQIAAFLDWKTRQIDALIAKKKELMEKLKEKRLAVITQAVTKGLDAAVPMRDSCITWLGDVPKNWEVKPVKYLTKILRGQFAHRPRNDPAFYDGEYPFVQTGDIARAGKYVTTYSQTLNERGLSVSRQFPAGTLVMTIAANIGDMAIIEFPACFPDSIVGFIPEAGIELDFLYYMFIAMKHRLMMTAVLNTQLNLNIDRISSIETAAPPHEEQKKIVAHVDREIARSQQLMGKAEDAIARLTEYRTALITAATTGKIDLRHVAIPAPT